METNKEAVIIGGGLAGCEAAWQLAAENIKVKIFEMRPISMTPVHKSGALAELVCSNSLKSSNPYCANGILHNEMRRLGSVIMQAADIARVPAGQALAVDREELSRLVETALANTGLVTVERKEIEEIPSERPCIIASGPMTSYALAKNLSEQIGTEYLYFYDAVAPIVSLDTIDLELSYKGSRYGKGDAEYINCPLSKEEYDIFLHALLNAEKVVEKEYEQKFFEGCLPVEEIASRGYDTLRYGPMKPVGLTDPRTGKEPYAVIQLRQENKEGSMYNLVGFQTRLKWNDQKRVFRLIPALKNAEFLRLGVMHRNIFINAPAVMTPSGEISHLEGAFLAGQISGVEGYVESAASGILCGINAARKIKGQKPLIFPKETAIGSLMRYITSGSSENFQPMNINMGLFPPLEKKISNKQERYAAIAKKALVAFEEFIKDNDLDGGDKRIQI